MESSTELQPGAVIKPNIYLQDVKELTFDLYGLRVAKVVELHGYDDKNYHIFVEGKRELNKDRDSDNSEFVLKIINVLDSKKPEVSDAQTNLLLHLRQNEIRCPRPIPTKDNLYFAKIKLSSGEHIVRLLEYIRGTIVYNIPVTPSLLRQTGEFVARLDKALMNFKHSAYDKYKPFWTLESVPKLRHFIYAVSDEERRNLVVTVVNEFEDRVVSVSNAFEKGMIHGDFNEQNIIVEKEGDDWKIKGVIDFGDCHVTCYLYEVAITMTYMMLQAKDIDAGGYVFAGYDSVREISEREYSLLKVCIASRLCQSLVIGAYTSLQDPKNSYVLTTAAYGWTLLEAIWKEPEENLLARWKKVSDL